MAGVRRLRKLLLGLETTAGTEVDTDTMWRGQATLDPGDQIEIPDEDLGQLVPKLRSYIPHYEPTIELDETPATFEQLPIILAMALEATTTGAADTGTGASGIIYQFDLANTTQQIPATFTAECGDNQREDVITYLHATEFELSGASGEAVMMSATLRGRQASDGTFTTSVSAPTVEEILFNKGVLTIDDAGGTIGTTTKANTLLGFSVGGNTGIVAIEAADGAVYFSTIDAVGAELEGELTFRHDATGEAELNLARAEAARLVRLVFAGSALGTAGGAYTYKTLQISMAIQYTEVPSLDDQDGNDVITLPFRVIDSDSTQFQVIVVNEVAGI
jgi:hypothetical protein